MKYTRTVYYYKGKQYELLNQIRRLPDLFNVSIPDNPTDEQLSALGVTREEVMVSLAEAKNIKLNELYGIYELLRDKPTKYKPGDRVCQLVIMPIPAIEFIEVDELSETDRGAGGFGSTGVR